MKADKVQGKSLNLHKTLGATMTYIFDFGDWWEFDLKLEKIDTDDLRTDYGAIIESKDSAPPQYPDWEDEDWKEDDDYD